MNPFLTTPVWCCLELSSFVYFFVTCILFCLCRLAVASTHLAVSELSVMTKAITDYELSREPFIGKNTKVTITDVGHRTGGRQCSQLGFKASIALHAFLIIVYTIGSLVFVRSSTICRKQPPHSLVPCKSALEVGWELRANRSIQHPPEMPSNTRKKSSISRSPPVRLPVSQGQNLIKPGMNYSDPSTFEYRPRISN